MVHRIEEVVAATPEVAGFVRRTGAELGLFATEQNRGDIVVKLKPASARKRNAEEIIEEQRAAFATEMPGMTIEFVQPAAGHAGRPRGESEPVEVKIFGDDLAASSARSPPARGAPEQVPGLVDLVVPSAADPEVDVRIDPIRAARVGSTVEQVASQLSAGLLGRVATSFRRGDRLIDVRVRFPDQKRFDLDWIRQFPLTSAAGEVVPLSTTSTIASPRARRSSSARTSGRWCRSRPGSRAGTWARACATSRPRLRRSLAGRLLLSIGGLFESQQASFRSMLLVLAIAVLLVFGAGRPVPPLHAGARDPLRRSAVARGRLRAAAADGDGLERLLFMGLILLIGLIVKNGIILVDYADLAAAGALRPPRRLLDAGSVRLRPILMTTLCTLFGLLPLALGLGSGAELQKPLAIAVIGGLSVSTAVTLLFVPTSWRCSPPRRASALSGTAPSGRLGGNGASAGGLFRTRSPGCHLLDLLDGQDQIREALPRRECSISAGSGMTPLWIQPVDLRRATSSFAGARANSQTPPGISADAARRGRLAPGHRTRRARGRSRRNRHAARSSRRDSFLVRSTKSSTRSTRRR